MNRRGLPSSLFPALIALIALVGSPAVRAQGVPDPRTGIALPTAQSAAVEDATALLVNPAGLALVEGFEVNLGGFLRSDGRASQTDLDGALVTTPMRGLGIGLGMGLTFADAVSTRLRTSAGIAAAADSTFSLGAALHAITPLGGSGSTDWSLDVGSQIRPARWLALGIGIEGLGDQDLGPASGRGGVSLRPLGELLTVGLDARLIPGSRDPGSARYAGALAIVPGAAVRLDLGGLALTAGASMKNLGAQTSGRPELELGGALEVNGGKLGATLLGGADGILAATQRGWGGGRLRLSSAEWTPIFPDRGRWLAFALAGEGVPLAERNRSLLTQLFTDEPQPIAILAALRNAAEDEGVDGVLIELKGLSLGWGRLAELRGALVTLREAGKKVVVHLDSADDADMYLASAADRIYLSPAGHLEMNGLRAELLYLGDTLGKIGIEAEAVAAGRYKSAPRQLTANEPSEEELEVQNALLDGVYGAVTEMVAAGRGLAVDEVKAIIDRGGLTGPAALEAKLIDGLAYPDELKGHIDELAGRRVFLETRHLSREERRVRWDTPPRIAIIPVDGTITMGGGISLFGRGASARDIIDAIEEAAGDDDVKAIVLRVDSPGGDALASDLIWRAVMKAREKKPVVASLGDVAASGGYYVAAGAHTILAEPNTVTGSIGVFGLLFNAERLADDIGVRTYPLERGALPGPSTFRPLSDAERAALQLSVDATYERFLDAVTAGRGEQSGLDKEQLRAVAEGRVWTGAQAEERKLVDRMGGIMDALDEARSRAGLGEEEQISIQVITGRGDSLGRLMGFARAFRTAESDSLVQAARLLLGDPQALSFALTHEGRPLALTPARLHVE
jgi:protease IV